MFAVLSVDGTPIGLSDDVAESITLQFDTDSAPTHRCRACEEELTETRDGYESTSGDTTCAEFEPTADTDPDDGEGPHDPERIPLSWCNSAAVHTDESEDSVTVSISVGDQGSKTIEGTEHTEKNELNGSTPEMAGTAS